MAAPTVIAATMAIIPAAYQRIGSAWLQPHACSGTSGGRQHTSSATGFGESSPSTQATYPKNQAGASRGHVIAIGTKRSAA